MPKSLLHNVKYLINFTLLQHTHIIHPLPLSYSRMRQCEKFSSVLLLNVYAIENDNDTKYYYYNKQYIYIYNEKQKKKLVHTRQFGFAEGCFIIPSVTVWPSIYVFITGCKRLLRIHITNYAKSLTNSMDENGSVVVLVVNLHKN